MRISPFIDITLHSSQEVALTDEQVFMLQRRLAEFRAADPDGRSNIIRGCVDDIKRSWGEGVQFDRDLVETVRALSTMLCPSDIFVARSPAPLQQEAGSKETAFYQKMDVP